MEMCSFVRIFGLKFLGRIDLFAKTAGKDTR